MGLTVANALSIHGWRVYIFYHKKLPKYGEYGSLVFLRFIQADVTSWESLSSAFFKAFVEAGKVDFVFANAGVIDEDDFLGPRVRGPIQTSTIDVDLKGAIETSRLAWKYFLLSPHNEKDAVLVINAGITGLVSIEGLYILNNI